MDAVNSPYRYERINESLYNDLCYISRSAFGFDPGISFYRRKNQTSAFGEPNLGFIAYSATGEPAAFYGVYASLVEYEGRIYHAAQSGDTMTHKSHAGKGLFTTLARMTYELAREKGIEFVYGSPNYNSLPGFIKKLNWVCPEKMVDYRISVSTLPVSKLVKKLPWLNKIYLPFVNSAFKRIAGKKTFQNSVIQEGFVGVHRNEAYYRYKAPSGSHLIILAGINAWIKLDGILIIGDIDLEIKPDMDHFIMLLKRFCFWNGISEIAFVTSPGTSTSKLFSEHATVREGLPVGYVSLATTLPLEKFKMVFGDIDTF